MNIQSMERNESFTRHERMRLGTAERRDTGVSELSLIAAVNEAIKHSIASSRRISMIAINANLMAGRAGARAAGFGVMAHELRRFSDSMVTTMLGWSGLIYTLVQRTAQSRNQARRMNTLLAAGRCSPKAQEAIAAACERSRNALEILTQRNSVGVLELQGLISRAEQQGITGEVIARSSMIESAYGGAMRPALQQIAMDIDASIANFSSGCSKVGSLMQRVPV